MTTNPKCNQCDDTGVLNPMRPDSEYRPIHSTGPSVNNPGDCLTWYDGCNCCVCDAEVPMP